MLCKAREPLFAANDVGRSHEVIVDRVSKVVGRNAVGFEENEVLVVLRNFEIALDEVGKAGFLFGVAVGKQTQDKGIAVCKMRLDFVERDLAVLFLNLDLPCVVLVPVFCFDLGLFIDRFERFEFFFGGKDRVGFSLGDKPFGVDVIDRTALALLIGSVDAFVGDFTVLSDHGTFVKMHAVVCERADQSLGSACHFALGVGVLNAQIKDAAALVSKPLADGGGKKPSEMHKAGGAGRKAGHFCSLGQNAGREARFHILGRFCYTRKEKLGKFGKFLQIHKGIILSKINFKTREERGQARRPTCRFLRDRDRWKGMVGALSEAPKSHGVLFRPH